MTGDKIRFPTRQLIFKDLRFVGFWMDQWNRTKGISAQRSLLARVFEAIKEGTVNTPIEAVYPIERFEDALHHNSAGRMGKVLFGDV